MVEERLSLHPKVWEGLRLFNAGHYFEAHEALEAAWNEDLRPIRELYRGLLQAAVTYLHIQRGNYAGACKMYVYEAARLLARLSIAALTWRLYAPT